MGGQADYSTTHKLKLNTEVHIVATSGLNQAGLLVDRPYDPTDTRGLEFAPDGQLDIGQAADGRPRKIYSTDDMEVTTSGAGVVLLSPDGTRYRLQVLNGGAIKTTAL